jgi:hypothetical protein
VHVHREVGAGDHPNLLVRVLTGEGMVAAEFERSDLAGLGQRQLVRELLALKGEHQLQCDGLLPLLRHGTT